MIALTVSGIGLLGPGLADWAGGQALLREPSRWQPLPTLVPPPNRLPATERRRAGTVVKASIVVADEAVAAAAADPAQLATVFTSSTGDPLNCHLLCEALAAPARGVSPTRFTNSVHNAAAGYWHIATQSRQPSTSLAAFDASFAAGLLEAAVQCRASGAPVLLVACDVPYPEPLHRLRPVADSFALALLLAPPGRTGRALTLDLGRTDQDDSDKRAAAVATGLDDDEDAAVATPCTDAGLEALRRTIPAARALPLLQALAGGAAADLRLAGAPGTVLHLHVGAAA